VSKPVRQLENALGQEATAGGGSGGGERWRAGHFRQTPRMRYKDSISDKDINNILQAGADNSADRRRWRGPLPPRCGYPAEPAAPLTLIPPSVRRIFDLLAANNDIKMTVLAFGGRHSCFFRGCPLPFS